MTEQQAIPTDEEADRELEDAEKKFNEPKEGVIDVDTEGEIVEVKGEIRAVSNPKSNLPYIAEENQQILVALGFKRYDDKNATNFGIKVMNTKIGVKFNSENPTGKVWAYELTEDNKKDFYKNGNLRLIPLVEQYYNIQEGKEPIPETSVTGKITEKRGKAVKVEIEENGETKEIFYGQGAVKKDKGGYFLPAGFSKATKDHEAKMAVPRDIRLPDYETQLEQAPVADLTKEKEGEEKAEPQPTGKSTMDEVIKREPTEYTESIAKYTGILAEVTEAIFAEDRIPSREKGYAVKFVYYSVVGEMENSKGGDHEE